jgi:predicted tellurium resistance membrane protein TerC
MDFSVLFTPEALVSILMLTFMEVVLGIDNIIFISLESNKLPKNLQQKATNIGLALAMILRILLLFGINILIAAQEPIIHFDNSIINGGISWQSIILIAGGLFLIYKSTTEIHHKLEGSHGGGNGNGGGTSTMSKVIIQITLINIVFSADSILTAVGMTNGVEGAMVIMITAIIISMVIMMLFANPVGNFVNENPTIQILGLSFLILIGFMLMTEGAHLGHIEIFGEAIGAIPKGYLYFAIFFSLIVEMLNMRFRKKVDHIDLNSATSEATKKGILHK